LQLQNQADGIGNNHGKQALNAMEDMTEKSVNLLQNV